jgi:hypothetical protein
MLVLERIECSPFTLSSAIPLSLTHIDGHALLGRQSHVRHLGNVLCSLHVCGITSCTEDDGNLGVWVDIVGCDEGTGSIVDQRSKFCPYSLLVSSVRLLTYQSLERV